MSSSVQFDLVPGRVVARVFAHDLRASQPVSCFSYVTEGLRAFGQDEVVFTLVRPPDAGIERAPHDPLHFLRAIANLATQGQLVSAGGFTEVGAQGLLGRPHIRGVAYERAWPMDGVTLPDGCLSAAALVAHEMDSVKRFGALRTLARLGRAYRFFPTAPWCDPDRGPMPPEGKSILEGVASAYIPFVSVVRSAERITVRLARSAQARLSQGLPPPEAALAFLTVLDPSADGCLVWSPGQQAPEAISPPGSRGERLSGCFALFVPQQASDGGNPFEDGFAITLTDASWGRVRQALVSATPLAIANVAIEWFDVVAPRAAPIPPVSEMQMQIREPQPDIDARIGMQALVGYADAIERTVQQHFAGQTGQGAVLELDVLLAAGRPPALRVSCFPELAAAAALPMRLASIQAPPLRMGEIAFRGTFALFGGAPPRA